MNGRTDNESPAAGQAALARRGELIGLAAAAVDAFVLPKDARVGSANPSPGDALRASLGQYSAGTVEWEVGTRGRSTTVGLSVSVSTWTGAGGTTSTHVITAIRVAGTSTPDIARQVAVFMTALAALAECMENL